MIAVIVIAILAVDQATKFLITKNVALHQSIPVIQGIFHITLIHNRGAAFGILRNQLPLFIVTAVVAILLIALSLRGDHHRRMYRIALALVLAGAVGNLLDRIFFGYVIDFLDLRVWPVFNVADSAITIGACMLGLSLLKPEKR